MKTDPQEVGETRLVKADKALVCATDHIFDWVLSFPNPDHMKILEAVAAIHAARRALTGGQADGQ